MVGVRSQAITQVKEKRVGSIFGWVTASPWPARIETLSGGYFSETADWRLTLFDGRHYWPRFSTVFPPEKKKFDLTRSNLDLVRSDSLFTSDITRSDWLWVDLTRYNQI